MSNRSTYSSKRERQRGNEYILIKYIPTWQICHGREYKLFYNNISTFEISRSVKKSQNILRTSSPNCQDSLNQNLWRKFSLSRYIFYSLNCCKKNTQFSKRNCIFYSCHQQEVALQSSAFEVKPRDKCACDWGCVHEEGLQLTGSPGKFFKITSTVKAKSFPRSF